MAVFEKVLDHLFKWEGGLVNHPSDPGGLTNLGITFNTFKSWAKKVLGIEPTEENLKSLTKDQAAKIYKEAFWDKLNASSIINQDVANIVFDAYVNMTSIAVPLLQWTLNKRFNKTLAVDGVLGEKTLQAVNSVDGDSLHDEYKKGRVKYYNYRAAKLNSSDKYFAFFQSLGINPRPDQQVFLRGWLNRALSFVDKKKA